jgi:hypothetical protein
MSDIGPFDFYQLQPFPTQWTDRIFPDWKHDSILSLHIILVKIIID